MNKFKVFTHVLFLGLIIITMFFYIVDDSMSDLNVKAEEVRIFDIECVHRNRKKHSLIYVKLLLQNQVIVSYSEKSEATKCEWLRSKSGDIVTVYDRYGYVIGVFDQGNESFVNVNQRITSFNMTIFSLVTLPLLILWIISIQAYNRWEDGNRGIKLFFF